MSTMSLLPPERSHIESSPLVAQDVLASGPAALAGAGSPGAAAGAGSVAAGACPPGGGSSLFLQPAATTIAATVRNETGPLRRVLIATAPPPCEWARPPGRR